MRVGLQPASFECRLFLAGTMEVDGRRRQNAASPLSENLALCPLDL
jgi:hypothetical protein